MAEKVLMKGNEAIAESAIRAGCRFFFGYPITPQTELAAYMAKRMPKEGGTYLQAESEVAAINMVYGASAAGARVMTSSSSPGVSLKSEGVSYIAGADLPCLIINIERGGPGLGSIQPSQSDYWQATRALGHGDFQMVVYAPSTVQEMSDLAYGAFDIADKYRTPVMILGDGMLGQMIEPVELPEPRTELPEKLRRLCSKIFRNEFLLTDWTSDMKGLTAGETSLKAFSAGLSAEDMTDEEKTEKSIGTCPTKNEAFMTPGMVQYNGCVGDFIREGFAYHGGMNVLQNILGSEYLWNLIREKGGAYGCMCGMSENGSGYFVSYRDPKLDETYAAYETVPDYIRSMELDDRELTKYIIGAIGKADRPMTPYTKGVRSLTAFLGGYTESDRIRRSLDAVKAVLDSGWFCSVGSESAIKASEKPFEHITQLLR